MYNHSDNIEDTDIMKAIIDSRDESQTVIPLYVKIYNNKYSILDIDEIINRVNLIDFKVGFGSSSNIFSKPNHFPTALNYQFNIENSFSYTDENDIDMNYFIFEEGYLGVNELMHPRVQNIRKEMNDWIEILHKKCYAIGSEYVKRQIREELNRSSSEMDSEY